MLSVSLVSHYQHVDIKMPASSFHYVLNFDRQFQHISTYVSLAVAKTTCRIIHLATGWIKEEKPTILHNRFTKIWYRWIHSNRRSKCTHFIAQWLLYLQLGYYAKILCSIYRVYLCILYRLRTNIDYYAIQHLLRSMKSVLKLNLG